ncbi:hypothetical protein GGTG_05159 [Gaeumannomyces tritici R3-111a-1]|uniref:Uncharacterized protein n=1 Tax=Gaeumannomyces tritici (strain R3-111a-1) TaxID=644352 RepID=J3NV46_GAET3|nr:hypothetical protein GGTG_05159 [Gaeumannomyces tritici R3-111a-1]EJT75222.1 hypothetical protein GGTG_05159 [Gaeumannomyces tritici R3-111a-1]
MALKTATVLILHLSSPTLSPQEGNLLGARAKPPGKKEEKGIGIIGRARTLSVRKKKLKKQFLLKIALLVLRKAKLFLNRPYLKNLQYSKILFITLTITNLFSKTKKNVTQIYHLNTGQLKSLREIPLLNKKIINCLKRSGFVRIW